MSELTDNAKGWDVGMSIDSIYQVFSTPRSVVDTKEKTCTCKLWQINGLPCAHAAAVIFLNMRGNYTLMDPYFLTKKFKESYAPAIISFPLPESEAEDGGISPLEHH